MVRTTSARGVVAWAAAGLLTACGHGTDSARAGHEAHEQQRAGARDEANAAAEDADMVSAVSSAASATPVSLRFKLREPPRAGQQLRLELALVQAPGLEIDSMLMSLQPSDGLALESDRTVEFKAPAVGATQRVTVTLHADQVGLVSLGATILVDAGSNSLARVFSIPLIVVAKAE